MAAAIENSQIPNITRYLYQGARADSYKARRTAFLVNNIEVYRILISISLNIRRSFSGYRRGPLASAVYIKDRALIKFLLENGAKPDRDGLGRLSVLGVVLYYNIGIEIIKQLINYGANTGIPSLLTKAAYSGKQEYAEYILKYRTGININKKGYFRSPLLYITAKYSYIAFLGFLLEHGTNIMARDYNGKTTINRAEKAGQIEVVLLLNIIIGLKSTNT